MSKKVLMHETKPAVSIVMCTFNGSLYLEGQLNSILAQTYPIAELLIFDDASTDGTLDIINRFSQKHSFIRVHVNPLNIGFTRNFEQALRAATSPLIAIADQDDVWLPGKLERMIEAWEDDSPLIYCGSVLFKTQMPKNSKPNPLFRPFTGTDPRKIFLRNTVSGHATLIRKELLGVALPFHENIMYDWWLAVVAACNGGVQHYPEVLVMQRQHEHNITANISISGSTQRRAYKKYIIRHLDRFSQVPGMEPAQKEFADTFSLLLQKSLAIKFSLNLFSFILRHAKTLFHYKKRRFPLVSYVKHAYKRTLN